MNLLKVGRIVYDEWIKSPGIRPDMNIELGEFVVMYNHFHAVIIIGENEYNRSRCAMHNTRAAMRRGSRGNELGPQSHNLASVIRGFKSAGTLKARFHDHIIRNEKSFTNSKNNL